MTSVRCGAPLAIEFLLQNGVNVNATTDAGQCDHACNQCSWSMAPTPGAPVLVDPVRVLLTEHGGGPVSRPVRAAAGGSCATLYCSLDKEPAYHPPAHVQTWPLVVPPLSPGCNTPLHVASKLCNIDCIKVLLRHSADHMLKNTAMQTPIECIASPTKGNICKFQKKNLPAAA